VGVLTAFPIYHLQIGNVVEVTVPAKKRRSEFQADCSNPNIVFWYGTAFLFKFQSHIGIAGGNDFVYGYKNRLR